jgi:hypothetical protein
MATVPGRFILMIDAMVSGRAQREARTAMKIPIADLQPEEWYDFQSTLLLYEQAIIDGYGGPIGLKMAGTRVIPMIKKQTTQLDTFTNPRALFEALNDIYLSNNTGPDVGYLKAVETTDDSVVIEDTSPHLPELELGVAEGIVKVFPGCFLTSSEILERSEARRVYRLTWKSK